MTARIKKSLGRRGRKYGEDLTIILNQSWQDIINILAGADAVRMKGLSTGDMTEIRRMFEEVVSHSTLRVQAVTQFPSRQPSKNKKELNTEITEDGFFEIPYDYNLLSVIVRRFYFKGTIGEKDELHQREFLIHSNLTSNFAQYCAPQLSEVKNPAIDLPYFWCRGKECFHNNLGTQTLEEEINWYNYTLFHLSEIIGFPMLHKTVAGYEPEPTVWQFIAITNKVMQKFRRLKCRACGHMMFTERTSGFNRYNYYECVNPTCAEVRHPVYLNFCFKCKKGLIDSRDTKQCPNGWYICPTCLACCDDEQYERQAQRYILTNRPVPPRIQEKRGNGHNDKGVYFCPQCGNPIKEIDDGHGNTFRGCPECNINFDARPDGFYG